MKQGFRVRQLSAIMLAVVIICLGLSACKKDSSENIDIAQPYSYGFVTGGVGGKGWPVWVEDFIINESWRVPVGGMSGGPENPEERLPVSTMTGWGLTPLPTSFRANWFSYRTQSFYEIFIEVPEGKREDAVQWMQRYPQEKYKHDVTTGISGKGTFQAWWVASCLAIDCPKDHFEQFKFELVPLTLANQVEGDALNYRTQTLFDIETGRLPLEVLDLLPVIEPEFHSGVLANSVDSSTLFVESIKFNGEAAVGGMQAQVNQAKDFLGDQVITVREHGSINHIGVTWVSLEQQQRYQLDWQLSAEQQQHLNELNAEYPADECTHVLALELSANGDIQLDWRVYLAKSDIVSTQPLLAEFNLAAKQTAVASREGMDVWEQITRSWVNSGLLPLSTLELLQSSLRD